MECMILENHPSDSRVKIRKDGVFQALCSRMGTGGNNVPMVVQTVYSVWPKSSNGMRSPNPYTGCVTPSETARTLDCSTPEPSKNQGGDMVLETGTYWKEGGVVDTLTAKNAGGGQRMPDKDNYNGIIQGKVRRLTPVECERLQGLPDDYTNVPMMVKGKEKPASDSNRYKAIGNGMAQPCADWVIKRIVEDMT